QLIADTRIKERSVRELLARPNEDLLAVTGVPEGEWPALLARAAAAARVDAATPRDGGAVCIHDERYPTALRDLPDLPRALFHTGPLDRLMRLTEERTVAVVGTRTPSEQGRRAAADLGRGLAAAGITVVSGMALGIDAICHRGALDGGEGVLAVLASGADVASPRTNVALYREIRSVGAVVSEMPWGASPWPWLFPARNRIMAAVAELTVVVEAALRSGSLITATFAADLNRTVGAMPGAPGARITAGNNDLVKDGALVIRDARDVLDDLYGTSDSAKLQIDLARERIADQPQLIELLDAVEIGASLDEMSARTGLSARELRTALSRLERTGLVRRSGLGSYVACSVA
ncbi:MAG: processing protein, partial [Thermoleophilales bacterium]|nr:processing protein [Thermoleophilales bacterium]